MATGRQQLSPDSLLIAVLKSNHTKLSLSVSGRFHQVRNGKKPRTSAASSDEHVLAEQDLTRHA
ncbi:hypothetical protein VCV18_005359 [Metarhizium anisopliae]